MEIQLDQTRPPIGYGPTAVLFGCVTVVALMLTWTYLVMRSVMDVGGACAEGGAYEIARPCPGGVWMIAVAVPVLIITSIIGSALALGLSAPSVMTPMWGLLFGSLGWNFLDYGAFSDELVWGWIVCGVVFELMALPAFLILLPSHEGAWNWVPRTPSPTAPFRGVWWWPTYVGFGMIGLGLGTMSFHAWN